LTDAELEKVEDISTKYIEQNSQVYALEVPLATARNIKGVRAVFGETYPDPVRVVSVGVSVEDLLQDVQNTEWNDVSVEFCGGTHVDKTGEIKKLVILEESGIARGIRRIIAVTGQTAYDVQRVAALFGEKLDSLGKLPFSPEKEERSKRLRTELNELSISLITKKKLNDQFTKIATSILDAQKAATKAANKKVLETVTNYFSAEENQDKKHLIVKLPFSTSGKAVAEAIKYVSTKSKDKTVYLIGADETEGKVAHGCHVSEVSVIVFSTWKLALTDLRSTLANKAHLLVNGQVALPLRLEGRLVERVPQA